MIIDVKPILSGETDAMAFDIDYDVGHEIYGDIVFETPLKLKGVVKNMSGYMTVSFSAIGDYNTMCARCLKPLEIHFESSTERSIAVEGTLQEENDDYLLIKDSVLSLDEAVEDLLIYELPQKSLCSEDCKGLCQKCGKDLNDGDCSCPKKEPDPRLAVLGELFKKNEK